MSIRIFFDFINDFYNYFNKYSNKENYFVEYKTYINKDKLNLEDVKFLLDFSHKYNLLDFTLQKINDYYEITFRWWLKNGLFKIN